MTKEFDVKEIEENDMKDLLSITDEESYSRLDYYDSRRYEKIWPISQEVGRMPVNLIRKVIDKSPRRSKQDGTKLTV